MAREINVERDPWIALDEGGEVVGDRANVVRIPLKRTLPVAESASLEQDVAEAGDHFVHLMDQIADAVAKSNARSEALARRAVTALQRAEARVRQLETRLARSESQVAQSEELIARLHLTVREKFERFAPPSSAA